MMKGVAIFRIFNCNNDLLNQQKKELINEIVYGRNKEYFKVFDIEAGCGKTWAAEEGLAALVNETEENAIFVRRSNEDGQESADRINGLVRREVAFAYNGETIKSLDWPSISKTLSDFRIIIITHKRYHNLCLDVAQRRLLTKNRRVLVIDEFISDVQRLDLNMQIIKTIRAFFYSDPEITEKYNNFIKYIESYISAYPRGKYFGRVSSYLKNALELKRLINNNFDKESVMMRKQSLELMGEQEMMDMDLLSKINSKAALLRQIDYMQEFYKNVFLSYNGNLSIANSKCQNWLLDNNIILDASGSLQAAYNLNPKLYKLKNNPKVLDHSNWELINIIVTTIKSKKTEITNYYERVYEIVNDYNPEDTLIIGSKDDFDNKLEDVPVTNKAYLGNITGSNKWGRLKNAMLIQTPNIDDVEYVLQYLHYSKKDIDNDLCKWTSKTSGKGTRTKYEFIDKRFEKIRSLWLAEQIYQAIKRVNRDMSRETKVIILMNNKEVIKLLAEKLHGCSVRYVEDNSFECEPTKKEKYLDSQREHSQANQFIKLLEKIQDGKHPELWYKDSKGQIYKGVCTKKAIRVYLGIGSAKDFYNKVLSKSFVITYMNTNNIQFKGQFIKLAN